MLVQIARGMIGLAALLAVAVIFSTDRRSIDRGRVARTLALQLAIGALVLFVPPGRTALRALASGVQAVLSCGNAGIGFLFGGLIGPRMDVLFPDGGGFVFALRVLPQIIYISALIAILYKYGVMQRLARVIGGALVRVTGASPLSCFSAVLTVFLGQSEMPVALRPYVPTMGRAELMTVMCSGTASIAGSVLAGYAALGVPMDYLLAASFMAIPGGLMFAHVLMPVQDGSRPLPEVEGFGQERAATIFEVIGTGAMSGVHVAVAVGAMLIAFIGLIALLNGCVGWMGSLIGHPGWTLQGALGVVCAPVAWAIGTGWSESRVIGGLIGQKLIFNEFVAYVELAPMLHTGALSKHSAAIGSFALCGFANLSSIGILIAGFGSVAPERRAEVAANGLRAVLAGSLSNLTSAAIAGMFIG
ncbi:nucleoside permease [Ameyamaea chiangmaiensis NBRC 103196]|nr:nucleoside permease [Ameyamaea chiangmaiensis NBRC 103196]